MCELTLSAAGLDKDGHELREIIPFTTEASWLAARRVDVTSTEISALFGQSPYMTKAELWYAKKSQEPQEFEANERMLWGTRLQDAIARGIMDDKGWKGRPMREYIRLPRARMGSSFDWRIGVGKVMAMQGNPFDAEADALLEIKNVDGLAFKQGWEETDFGLEAPPHIEMQFQHEMHVSGLRKLYCGALIGGNRVILLERDYDHEIGAAMQAAVEEFWLTIASNTPPPFDFENDAELISRLYSTVAGGKVVAATPKMETVMAQYKEAAAIATEADKAKAAARAELLTLVGDAEKVVGGAFTASLGIVNRSEYVVKASSYRSVRVTAKKV